MNTETALLHEIRSLRRTVLVCSACLVAGFCAATIAILIQFPSSSAAQPPAERLPADPLIDAKENPFNRDKAMAAAQEYISRYPQGYYGYSYLGQIYLASGDMVRAEANYSRSYAIVPLSETRLRLTAIRKSLGMQTPQN